MKKLLIGLVILFVTSSVFALANVNALVKTPEGIKALASIIETVQSTNSAGKAAIEGLAKAYGVTGAAALAKVPEVQKLLMDLGQVKFNPKKGTVVSTFDTNAELTESVARAAHQNLIAKLEANTKDADILAKVCQKKPGIGGELGESIRAIALAQFAIQDAETTAAFAKARLSRKQVYKNLKDLRRTRNFIATLEAKGNLTANEMKRLAAAREKLAKINTNLAPLDETALKLAKLDYIAEIVASQNPGMDGKIVFQNMITTLTQDFATAEIPADVRAHLNNLGLKNPNDIALASLIGVGHNIAAEWLPNGGKVKKVGLPALADYINNAMKPVIQGTMNFFTWERFKALKPTTRARVGICPVGAM